MYDRGYDLEVVDGTTKVSYGSVRSIFPFKPRDTVTRVAFRELPSGAGGGTLARLSRRRFLAKICNTFRSDALGKASLFSQSNYLSTSTLVQ